MSEEELLRELDSYGGGDLILTPSMTWHAQRLAVNEK